MKSTWICTEDLRPQFVPACRRALLFAASGIALAWCPQANAQGAATPQPTSPYPNVGLSEIVVTAERREERLQDVPITISAFDAKAIKAQAITDSIDLQKLTPGLVLNKNLGAAVPWLRGVGSNSSGFANEMPVATYIDGYYLSTPAAGVFSLNNIERIEVLKGPQGTLFGRNASAGVIQVITRDPDPKGKLDVGVGYGAYDTWSGEFYASTALTDELAFSLAAVGADQGKGWGKNLFTGSDAFRSKYISGQGKLQWTHGGTKVTLEELFEDRRSDVGIQWGVVPGELGADGTPFLGRYDISNRQDRVGHARQSLTGLRIEQETPIGDLVSLSGFNHTRSLFSTNGSGFPGVPIPGRSAINIELQGRADTFTQEVQLLSPSDAPFKWIVGAYYLHDRQALDQAIHGVCVGTVCAPPPPILIHGRLDGESYAAFGQGTFDVLPRTRLTVGLRYTEDKKSVDRGYAEPAPGYPNTPAALPPTSLARPGLPFPGLPNGIKTSAKWSKLTWRASLDYKITDDVMAFASANRGFKSGTYNITSFSNPPAAPEVLDAYEIGVKSTLLNHTLRLNGSVFYYDYKNIQLRTTSSAAPGQAVLFNAAQSTIKGVDLDVAYAPTSQLSLFASAEFLNAHYDKFPGGTCSFYSVNTTVTPNVGVITTRPCDRAGATMIRAPKFSGNIGGTYTWPTQMGDVALNVSDTYTSSFFWDPSNRIKQDAYHYVTASLTWTSVDKKYEAQIWGKNLNNAFFFGSAQEAGFGSDAYTPGEPRTYGVRLSAHF